MIGVWSMRIDEVDMHMLCILQKDGRITLSELSKRLNLSRPSVTERLNRLREHGVIEGIGARLSFSKVGRSISAFIQLSDVKVAYQTFEEFAEEQDKILECHRITGAISYMMKVAVKDMEELDQLVDQLVIYGTVNTSIILKSPVAHKTVTPIM